MTKRDPIGVRLELEDRAALEKAAASEVMSMSALARKIIVEWLRRGGWLSANGVHKPRARPRARGKQ